MELRHVDGGIEAPNGVHEVERGANDVEIVTVSDEPSVRNASTRECPEHSRFAPHRLVAVRALVERWPAKNETEVAALEAQQNVLRTASQDLDVPERPVYETLIVHPVSESFEIDTAVWWIRHTLTPAR